MRAMETIPAASLHADEKAARTFETNRATRSENKTSKLGRAIIVFVRRAQDGTDPCHPPIKSAQASLEGPFTSLDARSGGRDH